MSLLTGQLFTAAQIRGVVEADFFDGPVEVAGDGAWGRGLVRRLTRFAWHEVEHDVMKVLYGSVIAASTRHQLGEYYTPDWSAEIIVDEVVTSPLEQRVLDPACGSGTFLFYAVGRYLAAADEAGHTPAEASPAPPPRSPAWTVTRWTRAAEQTWRTHRTTDSNLALHEQSDYRRKLRDQFPIATHLSSTPKSGMYLAAAYLDDASAVIDHTLYWGIVSSAEGGRFLAAILNSDALTQVVRPLQARGEHNPRHFDKYVF